ncbi:hypothetical protein CRE_19613 [Caenorhabditis remanei]|uniref:Uncharacterized protein n=1 Tax=Caenorhabditis remanei TaxID=31234 RepID=E3NUB9_CAERE|nr:hypothetical protein CRE_19613 [Caenorhabditis remanei]
MDVDPTPRAKAESEFYSLDYCNSVFKVIGKHMDCDGFESHISSSDESYSEDNRGREADDEQSDWVGDTTPTRSPFETPFDRRVHIRRSQPNVHQTSSMQKKIEK